jgi:hypothetical protein
VSSGPLDREREYENLSQETAFIFVPLVLLLIGVMIDEIRSGLIRDVVTLPALLYMLVARGVIGPPPWFLYLLAAVGTVAMFALFFSSVPRLLGFEDWIGFGAVKLLAVVAAAVGLPGARWVAGGFVVGVGLWLLVARLARVDHLPSSPIVGLAVVVLTAARFILNAV